MGPMTDPCGTPAITLIYTSAWLLVNIHKQKLLLPYLEGTQPNSGTSVGGKIGRKIGKTRFWESQIR